MKKFLFAILAGSIPALIATNGANAQNSVNTEVSDPQANVISVEKAVLPEKEHTAETANISSRALKDFAGNYKNVTGERWLKNKEGFTARFTQDGVNNVIFYASNGNWSGSLKGYNEEKLPTEIRKIVKREYYDYSINYVQEIETTESEGRPTYIVSLEDKNTIIQVRIFGGEMEVWKQFQKQS